jgi:hypothetical protein
LAFLKESPRRLPEIENIHEITKTKILESHLNGSLENIGTHQAVSQENDCAPLLFEIAVK